MNSNFFLNSEVKILSKITGKTSSQIWLGDFKLSKKEDKIWQKLRQKLQKGIPLDYLLGSIQLQNGLKLELDQNVLIPRPETEFWLEIMTKTWQKSQFKYENDKLKTNLEKLENKKQVLEKSIKNNYENNFENCQNVNQLKEQKEQNLTKKELLVEIGCGSGLISFSLVPYFQKIIATDKSAKALKIAKKNSVWNQIKNVDFVKADLLNFDLNFLENKNWILVANLPYLPIKDLENAVENQVNFEPKMALYSGENGLICFGKLVKILEKIALQKLKNKFQQKTQENENLSQNSVSENTLTNNLKSNSRNNLKNKSTLFWQNLKLPSEIWLELDPRNIRLAKRQINLKLKSFYQTQIIKDYNNLERVLVCKIKKKNYQN